MNCKEKSWIWKLSFPFAHDNYTIVGHAIYHPKGKPPPTYVVKHEEIHEKQWMKEGFVKFYFLYLFALPVLWNPWRKQWELEAYTKGSGLSEGDAFKAISGKSYGWIA